MAKSVHSAISVLQYRTMFEQEWKKESSEGASCPQESALLESILSTLQSQFEARGISVTAEYLPTCASIDDSLDIASSNSCRSAQQLACAELEALQHLLLRQLGASLPDILAQVFEGGLDEESRQGAVQCLLLLQSLLRLTRIPADHRNRVLKWIYELTSLNVLSMELSNLLSSIKKRLLRLGFTVLTSIAGRPKEEAAFEEEDEEEFKAAVEDLIQAKQAEISGLKFELCRVCEAFMPINLMASHLNQCERIHQQQYLENKLEDKGAKLLALINALPASSEERFDLRVFFDRSYTTIGDVLATFALKGCRREVARVIQQYREETQTGENAEIYGQILELLTSYLQCLEREDRDNLSDKESKGSKAGKLKVRRRNRCSIGSNTSLIPSLHTVEDNDNSSSSEQEVASSKTINTDTEMRRGCLSLADFQVLEAIGKGSYSEVFLVRKRNTQDLFAMKVIEIEHLDEERLRAFKREQKIYRSITGGFNVKLYYSFGKANLYFLLLDYGCGGSLRTLLQQEVYFEERHAKLYLANLILAVDCIHRMGIVHRDLKPDNIVINEKGQLTLTDFNLSKLIIDRDNERSHTFFGTPDYIAPEVLRGEPASHMIDYFSLGVIAYEITIGVTPFTANSPQEVFESILKGEIEWPEVGNEEGQISKDCKDLLEGLLDPDPKKRLGANGLAELQNHPFFEGVNWANISQEKYFYVPSKIPEYQERPELLEYITGKMREESEGAVEGELVVRYDILKTITNKNLRSHRSSRFKLEKELEALRLLPSAESFKLRKHNSYNSFAPSPEEALISCRELQQ